MEPITFQPRLLTFRRILLFVILIIVSIITVLAIIDGSITAVPILALSLCVMGAYTQFTAWKINRISIDDRFFHYRSGNSLMRTIQGTISLANVDRISYAFGQTFVPGAKGREKASYNSFVFHFTDGKKEVVSLYGWDDQTLREMILYLKGKYPKIKYHTHVYRDSEEKLVGLLD